MDALHRIKIFCENNTKKNEKLKENSTWSGTKKDRNGTEMERRWNEEVPPSVV
jgi:hypothetical protein